MSFPKIFDLQQIRNRFETMSRHVDSLIAQAPNVPPIWQRFDYYETAVTLIVQDILRPGDTFYDCGANLGGISLSASRAVGPKGQVIAFEASPRIIPTMLANLRSWHATNVHLMPNAVWNKSGDMIPLYLGGEHFADSVIHTEGKQEPDLLVETLALDDVVDTFKLPPRLVKFDIEGAEQEALKGFTRTIEKYGPACILEMDGADLTLANWMKDAGYSLLNCNNYQIFEADHATPGLCNVLCLHEKDYGLLERFTTLQNKLTFELDSDAWNDDGDTPYIKFSDIEAGRYVLEYQPTEIAKQNGTFIELKLIAGEPWVPLTVHGSHFSHLCRSYTSMPIHLRRRQNLVFRACYLNLVEVKKSFNKVKLHKISSRSNNCAPWDAEILRL